MTTAPTATPQSERFRGVREAIGFLTPFGGAGGPPRPETMTYFPLVGAAIGAAEGLTWIGLRRMLPALPAAAIVVAIDAACTGALHLDGLADTADGLFAHVPHRERLTIMADPAVGTFGTLALGLSITLRTAALASTTPSPALLAALGMSARSTMVLGSRLLPYARREGLATSFLPTTARTAVTSSGPIVPAAERSVEHVIGGEGAPRRDHAVIAAALGLGCAFTLASASRGRRGGAAVAAGAASGAALLLLARRRLGGFTGDVLGAAGTICETVGQLVAVAR